MTQLTGARGGEPASVAADIIERLTARQLTVGCAESITGGLVVDALVQVPGASRALRGAVVAYAPELKTSLLGVDPAQTAARGTVDPQVALAMALGVCRLLDCDWGVATTGVAGPEPAEGKAPGVAYVAVARPGRGSRVRWVRANGDRASVRRATVAAALELLWVAVSAPVDSGRARPA